MKHRILFLCTGNSCRSQMAEGWTRHLKGDRFEAFSAGMEPQALNPYAIQVMLEAGVDISHHQSKHLDILQEMAFDSVVAVCTHAAHCNPAYPGKEHVICRSFDDPPKLAESARNEEEKLESYRRVRDEIRAFIEGFPESLEEIGK
ncbi:MAG: arsenate reductase ArsC [Verrucomicrobiota bacterium]